MRDFKNLNVWQKSHLFTLEIYKITSTFPREEAYGLVSQIRRSAASIPTNIAEGCGRSSFAELKQFLTIASGSASELSYQLILSKDLGYISESRFKELDTELSLIRKMMHAFSAKLSEQ
ncbi:four helix bundle protein [Arcticibacter sp. MXS-1]|uniref:four helix bundle protein n=1 Tax=Arcticibacter sp. MXS-1 TaxID=3341726 RepID=UPI0035A9AB11